VSTGLSSGVAFGFSSTFGSGGFFGAVAAFAMEAGMPARILLFELETGVLAGAGGAASLDGERTGAEEPLACAVPCAGTGDELMAALSRGALTVCVIVGGEAASGLVGVLTGVLAGAAISFEGVRFLVDGEPNETVERRPASGVGEVGVAAGALAGDAVGVTGGFSGVGALVADLAFVAAVVLDSFVDEEEDFGLEALLGEGEVGAEEGEEDELADDLVTADLSLGDDEERDFLLYKLSRLLVRCKHVLLVWAVADLADEEDEDFLSEVEEDFFLGATLAFAPPCALINVCIVFRNFS